jgi:hypothetical protein
MGPGDLRDVQGWESAFVAVSAIVGEPAEAVASALGDVGVGRASSLVRALDPANAANATNATSAAGATSKETRARALARAISDVVLAVDAMRYM